MFTRMKKFILLSIKLILNIIYVPFYIANRICDVIISYLKNTGIFGFIDKWMSFFYVLWNVRAYINPEHESFTMYKEIKEILINLVPRLLSLPFIAALAITKCVLMLAASVLHATNYVLEHVVVSGINKLITTIDSHIASYDEDDFSRIRNQGYQDNTLASETPSSMFDMRNSGIYSQFSNSILPNNTYLNDDAYADVRSRADSDYSTRSRESLGM